MDMAESTAGAKTSTIDLPVVPPLSEVLFGVTDPRLRQVFDESMARRRELTLHVMAFIIMASCVMRSTMAVFSTTLLPGSGLDTCYALVFLTTGLPCLLLYLCEHETRATHLSSLSAAVAIPLMTCSVSIHMLLSGVSTPSQPLALGCAAGFLLPLLQSVGACVNLWIPTAGAILAIWSILSTEYSINFQISMIMLHITVLAFQFLMAHETLVQFYRNLRLISMINNPDSIAGSSKEELGQCKSVFSIMEGVSLLDSYAAGQGSCSLRKSCQLEPAEGASASCHGIGAGNGQDTYLPRDAANGFMQHRMDVKDAMADHALKDSAKKTLLIDQLRRRCKQLFNQEQERDLSTKRPRLDGSSLNVEVFGLHLRPLLDSLTYECVALTRLDGSPAAANANYIQLANDIGGSLANAAVVMKDAVDSIIASLYNKEIIDESCIWGTFDQVVSTPTKQVRLKGKGALVAEGLLWVIHEHSTVAVDAKPCVSQATLDESHDVYRSKLQAMLQSAWQTSSASSTVGLTGPPETELVVEAAAARTLQGWSSTGLATMGAWPNALGQTPSSVDQPTSKDEQQPSAFEVAMMQLSTGGEQGQTSSPGGDLDHIKAMLMVKAGTARPDLMAQQGGVSESLVPTESSSADRHYPTYAMEVQQQLSQRKRSLDGGPKHEEPALGGGQMFVMEGRQPNFVEDRSNGFAMSHFDPSTIDYTHKHDIVHLRTGNNAGAYSSFQM